MELIESLMQYSPYEVLWFFVIYSVGGWCLEVAYHVVTMGKYVNRGFLNGPVCPIYGIGVMVVILCLTPVQDNPLLLYAGSVILASAIELAVGFLLFKLFHARWWDYSNEHFNLGGYICLKFSLEWGIACVLVVDVVHTFFARLVDFFPRLPGTIILVLCLITFAVDSVITVLTIMKMDKRLRHMNDVRTRIRKLSDACGEGVYEITVHGIEQTAEVKEKAGEMREKAEVARNELQEFKSETRSELQEIKSGAKAELQGVKTELKTGLQEVRTEMGAGAKTGIQEVRTEITAMQEELAELRAEFTRLCTGRMFGHQRIIKAFPTLRAHNFVHELKLLQDEVKRREALAEGKNQSK